MPARLSKMLSTETGCADFVQHVYDKMDQNEIVIALLFDLTRI